MARAEKSIVVRVPLRTAYRWWTTYEEFPEFLDGVTRVERRDETTQEWDVEIAGRAEHWQAHVEAEDQRRVVWRTDGKPHAEGEVDLKHLEGGQTLVTLRLVYNPDWEHDVEAAGGMVDRMVINSLERFKATAEAHEDRRLPDDDAPPPAGAETVDGPEGERGGSLDPEAGDLPYADRDQHHRHAMVPAPQGFDSLLEYIDDAEPTHVVGADDMGKVFDPDAAGKPVHDINDDDNEAEWSRTRP